jgi:two-component system chemotaxis response regulator CheB
LLSDLPAQLPVPVVVVQHMPPVFTRALAERLDGVTRLRVVEAADGMPAEAGTVYLAPGGRHLVLRREGLRVVLRLDDGPAENSCKPAADVTFRTASQVWAERVLAVVLTGMGHDGTAGAAAIRSGEGRVWAQDESSSVVWGMPGSVVRAGYADVVLPLAQIAPTLVDACAVTRTSAAQGLLA